MSFIVSDATETKCSSEGSSLSGFILKKEEQVEDEDFTFDEPCPKKQKTSRACLGRPASSSAAQTLRNELNMNWDLIEVLMYDLV